MLKKWISIIIAASLLPVVLVGQNTKTDTVEVSKDLAATMEFKSDVKTPIFGNNPNKRNYNVYVKDNILIISAARENAPFTTLTVLLEGDQLFKGYVKYNEFAGKNFYNYKKKIPERQTITDSRKEKKIGDRKEGIVGVGISVSKRGDNRGKSDVSDSVRKERMVKSRLEKVMRLKPKINTIGRVVGRVTFQVINIRNDSKRSYISMLVNNRSSSRFVVDAVLLRYVENGGFLGTKQKSKKRIFPEKMIFSDGRHFAAKNKQKMAFVISQFGTDEGNLVIKFQEKNGDRNINVSVPVKKINSSRLLNK
jgi:hypothetical protein